MVHDETICIWLVEGRIVWNLDQSLMCRETRKDCYLMSVTWELPNSLIRAGLGAMCSWNLRIWGSYGTQVSVVFYIYLTELTSKFRNCLRSASDKSEHDVVKWAEGVTRMCCIRMWVRKFGIGGFGIHIMALFWCKERCWTTEKSGDVCRSPSVWERFICGELGWINGSYFWFIREAWSHEVVTRGSSECYIADLW